MTRPYTEIHAAYRAMIEQRQAHREAEGHDGPMPLTPAEVALLDQLHHAEAGVWTSYALDHPETPVHE